MFKDKRFIHTPLLVILKWMSWLRTVDCFLPAPLPEPSISFPFLLDVIDLVELVWVWVEVRFGQGFVWEGSV